LLQAWSRGDQAALDSLIPLIYEELHRLSHSYLARERASDMLQTTALVHEAYLRLVKAQQVEWKDRVHFLAISARLMRRILVESARSRNCRKRGSSLEVVSLDEAARISPEPNADFVTLD
jgi:RNA polymerase sigma-70 factor (ECF subfamily)